MDQAQQQMKKALQNMQGVKQDLSQIAQQKQAAQQAMQQGQQAANGQQQGKARARATAQASRPATASSNKARPSSRAPVRARPGIARRQRPEERQPRSASSWNRTRSQDDENGKILASYMVKDKADPGVQKMTMQEIVKKAQNETTDEVDTEHANRAAQKVAQEYFRTMEKDPPSPQK